VTQTGGARIDAVILQLQLRHHECFQRIVVIIIFGLIFIQTFHTLESGRCGFFASFASTTTAAKNIVNIVLEFVAFNFGHAIILTTSPEKGGHIFVFLNRIRQNGMLMTTARMVRRFRHCIQRRCGEIRQVCTIVLTR